VLVTGLLLCAQFATAIGLPAVRPKATDASRPYPCQDRPCGCLTYDECWAGDCCCFTLSQKLDWAEKKGIEAPAHAKARAKPQSGAEKSCCTVPKASAKWVSAAFISACKGSHSEGMPAAMLLLPPMNAAKLATEYPMPMLRVGTAAEVGPVRSDSPPAPPPKSSC
jgi:hypothetical protein